MGGQDKVLGWVTELYRRFKPEVVVTQDINGEYGHPQHEMLVDAAIRCWDKAADGNSYPESVSAYGTWEVKKLYIHLYGGEAESTDFNWDVPMESMNGQTANEVAEDAFKLHVTQEGKGNKFNGKRIPFSVAEYGVKRYPNDRFGLYASRVGQDERHDDFLEHIDGLSEGGEAEASNEEEAAEPGTEEAPEDGGETPGEEITEEEYAEEEAEAEAGEEPEEEAEEETGEEPAEEAEEETGEEPAEEASGDGTAQEAPEGSSAGGAAAPAWADVTLNGRGFLDEGEYVLEDAENGHWMYVNRTLRIQVVRSWETPEKQTKKEAKQEFYCYTAEIWCDTENGELPYTTWSEPDKARDKMKPKIMKTIAEEQPMVFGTSTDYYTYRLGRSKSGVYEGVVIRDGEILYDVPAPIKKRYNFRRKLAQQRKERRRIYPGRSMGSLHVRSLHRQGRRRYGIHHRHRKPCAEPAPRFRHGGTRALYRRDLRGPAEESQRLHRRNDGGPGADHDRPGLQDRSQPGRRADGRDGLHGEAAEHGPEERSQRQGDQGSAELREKGPLNPVKPLRNKKKSLTCPKEQ